VKGIHYFEGVELAKSIFAKDPFNPVRHSKLEDLIREQSGTDIRMNPGEDTNRTDRPEIHIYDAAKEEDFLKVIYKMRSQGPPYIAAGSAGLAAYLPGLLSSFQQGKPHRLFCAGPAVVVSGSMSKQAAAQAEALRQNGFPAFALASEVELQEGFCATHRFEALCGRMNQALEKSGRLLIHTAGKANHEEPPIPENRRNVACENTSSIVKAVLAGRRSYTLAVVGGDTLVSILNRVLQGGLEILDEIEPGVVVSKQLGGQNGSVCIVSKAGSFGDEEILLRVFHKIKNYMG